MNYFHIVSLVTLVAFTHISEANEQSKDIWERIRQGFSITIPSHPLITQSVELHRKNPIYLERIQDRAEPYLFHIVDIVTKHNIPTEIALLPIIESAFRPYAFSSGSAAGLWQFIPSTGKYLGLKQNWWYDGRRDIISSTEAAIRYLMDLRDHFDGDWLLALAAYNSGIGRVQKAIKTNLKLGKKTDYWSLTLPQETKNYIPKLLAMVKLIKNSDQYGIKLKAIANKPYFSSVDTDSQIDLSLAADLAGLELNDIYRLNPGFNRGSTDPAGPHRLLLPTQHITQFEEALTKLLPNKRLYWRRHRILSGNTLNSIAKQYQTTATLLRQVNNLGGSGRIIAGKYLLIPSSNHKPTTYKLVLNQLNTQQILSVKTDKKKWIHTVNTGDTLWHISQKHNISVNRLALWNEITSHEVLLPGQELVIWKPKHLKRLTSISPLLSESINIKQSEKTQAIHYTVRQGDSLFRIARQFKVTVTNLRQWNTLKKGIYLQPGQKITLYINATNQSVSG